MHLGDLGAYRHPLEAVKGVVVGFEEAQAVSQLGASGKDACDPALRVACVQEVGAVETDLGLVVLVRSVQLIQCN